MSIAVGSNTLGVYPTTLTNLGAFYKYEPFSFAFTGGSNFTASGSLVAFCSGVGTTSITFAAANGFQSVGSSSGDTLTVGCTISGKSVSNSYTLFLNAGRFRLTPSSTVITMYKGEISSTAFTSQSNLLSVYTTPSLPPGVVFGTSNALPTSNWVLTTGSQGPTLVSANSNYTFFGSNASTGNSVFTNLSIQVLGERLTMTPTTSSSSLTIGTPMTSAIFSNVNYPVNSVSGGVVFGKPALPAGLSYATTAGPLLLGGSAYPLGTGIYVSGTPTLSSNIPSSNVSVTITTSAVGTTALSASAVLTFTYTPTIIFSSPSLSNYTTYVGVPISTTLGSNISLVAAVQFSPSNDPIVSYSASGLPAGLTLTPVSTTAFISGSPTTSGSNTVILTATSSSGRVGSNTFTITVNPMALNISNNVSTAQAFTVARSLTNPNSYYSYPITFTLSSPAYPSTSANWVSAFSINLSNGIVCSLTSNVSNYIATLSGTPQTSAPAGSVLTFSATTIDGTTNTANVSYSISNDAFTFSTSSPVPLIFSQNVAISPVQFFVSTLSETPATYFTPSITTPLPLGLTISSTGQLQGTPIAASSGYIIMNAANGYATGSPGTTQFPYVVLADTLHFTSTANSVAISTGANSIPLYAATGSGLVPQVIASRNYLYGLSLSSTYPFILTGSGDVSTVAVPASSRITLVSSNTVGGLSSVASTPLEIIGSNIPTVYRTTIRRTNLGYDVYRSSNLFSFSSVYSSPGSSSTLFDIQAGNGTYFVADGSTTIRALTGELPFTTGATGAAFSQLAYMSNTWYALGVIGGVYVYSTSNLWSTFGSNYLGFITSRTTDSGYVMRATSNNLLISGSTGIGYAGFGSNSITPSDSTLSNVNAISTTGPVIVAVGTPTTGSSIQYSSNAGSNWLDASGSFTGTATDVVYGGSASPVWLAAGSNASNVSIKYSSNGINWADSITFPLGTTIGPMNFAGTNWSVFVNLNGSNPVLSPTSDNSYVVYQHDILTSTFSDSTTWFTSPATFAATNTPTTTALYTFPTTRIVSNGTPTLTLVVGSTSSGGPTFVSPTTTNYVMYQYLPVSIVVDAGAGASYFVDTTTLPHGILWTTNISTGSPGRYTALLSGASMQLGTFPITIYAQLSTGVSSLTLTLNVNRLFPTTDHRSAAAYTAFTREKVIADAATSSVNNRVLPTAVGPFLLDTPVYETTAPAVNCDSSCKK